MNSLRNFFGWNAQKNIDNAQPNKVEKEFDGFEIIDNPISISEQRYISGALNIRNMSNNIISGVKKITSGVLDIVSYANPFNKAPANNKTPQQKAGMLSDIKNIQDLTEKVKLYFGIDNAYLKNKEDHLNVKNLMNLMKENQGLWTKIEKLESSKPKSRFESHLNEKKVSAILFLMSKNNAEILHNYICLASAKASNEGRDKQQMQYLFQVNDVAEKMAKKYENHAKNILGKISKLENTPGKRKNLEEKHNELKAKRGLNQDTNRRNSNKKISGKRDASLRPNINNKKNNILSTKSSKGTIGIYDKPYSPKNYIDSKPFESKSTEESSVFDDFDTEYDEQNKLMNEQKKELSKLRKEHGRINKFFAQYAQNDVSNEEIDKELEELGKKLKESQADTVPNSEEYINIELEKIEKEVENELKNQL